MSFSPRALACVLAAGLLWPLGVSSQTSHEDAVEKYSEAGQQALAAGQYDEALANFEQLVKLEPGIAEVHATLAVIYYKQRRYYAAVREIRTAKKIKPGLPKLGSLLGMSLAEQGHFQESLSGLEEGFQQTADPEVRRMCGLQLLRVYTGLQRDEDAVATALEMNKLYPHDPEVLYHTGRIFGNYTYVVMERLHDEAADSIWMMQAQGEAFESQKDYAASIDAFKRVLAMEPNRPGIHYRMGRVYLRRFQDGYAAKDRDAAVEQFQQELAIDPVNGNAAYELAQMDYDQGNLKAAQEKFETLLAQHPEFQQAQVGLAGVLLDTEQVEKAIPHLKQALAIDSGDEVAWYRLARATQLTGDTTEHQRALGEYRRLHGIKNSQRIKKTRQEANAGRIEESGDVTPQHIDPTRQP